MWYISRSFLVEYYHYQLPSSIVPDMVLYCLLDEMNGPTTSIENLQDFLFQKITPKELHVLSWV